MPGILAALVAALPAQYLQGNLVPNPSFEIVDPQGMPVGWHFHDARAGAKMQVDDTVAHTGRRSIKLINPHPLQPHVYGTLWARAKVQPNTWYTLSLYARSDDPGRAWFGCGKRWQRRCYLEPTGGKWRRFTLTFKTEPDERYVDVRINVDSVTEGLWVDSVQLEPGREATEFRMPPLPEAGEALLLIKPLQIRPNLLENGSFERWRGAHPEGWYWDPRNTDAKMVRDSSRAFHGRYSVKITNGTPFGPHVYGQLRYRRPVRVEPNTVYTISAMVWSEDPGVAWVGGATGWRVRAYLPRRGTAGQWVLVHKTFVTQDNETEIPIMINTDSPTPGFWVDAVKLEEGSEPTPFVEEGEAEPRIAVKVEGLGPAGTVQNPWWPERLAERGVVVAGGLLRVSGHVVGCAGADLVVKLTIGRRAVVKRVRLPEAQVARFEFVYAIAPGDKGGCRIEVAAQRGGRALVSQAVQVELVTPAVVEALLGEVAELGKRLASRIQALGPRGQYPSVTLTIARRFSQWIREDIQRGELPRAYAQALSLRDMLQAALGRKSWPVAPVVVTAPVKIRGVSFVTRARWPDGRAEERPVFFVGVGHFGQARRDADKMPDFGMNIIQIEFGPNSVLVDENTFSDAAIQAFREVCQRAARVGTRVNLLISPHYFPNWALRKWPHLQNCGGGFIRYCIHAPESRAVLEKFLRYTIPRIKDLPALHSICLSNEPVLTNVSGCRYAKENWHRWLRDRYGTVARMNEALGTKYGGFDDVPVPPYGWPKQALMYDFIRYNQEEFAAWHKFLADIIHEYAPDLPVHAKMMIHTATRRSATSWSIAPELFAQFCAINGNDAARWYLGAGKQFASSWAEELMGFELQRACRDAPVFNSEDHVIPDRNVRYQPPEYIYNVHWLAALHGRGASTTWVWERTYDISSDFCGSILHRPECVQAMGWACLDLNRLALEVTALQNARPKVAVLYALSGFVWHRSYEDLMRQAWIACEFLGVKPTFITERQLEWLAAGRSLAQLNPYLRDVKVIVAAGTAHLSARAAAGLRRFLSGGGKLVCVGYAIARDEHDKPLPEPPKPAAMLKAADAKRLMAALEPVLRRLGAAAEVELRDAEGQRPYGVEFFAARWRGGWLVHVSNLRPDSVRCSLLIRGRRVARAVDLISGKRLGGELTLQPLVPLLLRVGR